MANYYEDTKELLEKIELNTRDGGGGSDPGGGSAGGLTDEELRASAVAVTGPLTNAQLRATAVPVSGTFTTTGLTDAQLRATPVPVSGDFSTNGLTDAELRATAVPISGTVTATGPLTDSQLRASSVPVTGPATDAQIRATPIPVSVSTVILTSSLELITAAGNGTIASGAQSVSFSNYGPGDVTVAGGTLPATRGVSFDGGIHRLSAITYSIPAGTTLQIASVR